MGLREAAWPNLKPVAGITPFVDVAFVYFPVQNLLGIHFYDLTALSDQYILVILCAQICTIAAKVEDTIFMSKVIYKSISCLYLLKTYIVQIFFFFK